MIAVASIAALRDELTKIAEDSAQKVDPSMIEFRQGMDAEDKPAKRNMNREVAKQFLKDTALVVGGAGAGYGLGRLTVDALKKFKGPGSSPWRKALAVSLPVAGGGAALMLRGKMREEQDRRLEEAYRRGLQAGRGQ